MAEVELQFNQLGLKVVKPVYVIVEEHNCSLTS